jgi:hypothetical protein
MQTPGFLAALALLTTVGSPVTWTRVQSSLYPYTIEQPSSFRHVVLQDATNRRVDYFFPSLGSFTTNLHVSAVHGGASSAETRGGTTSEVVRLAGHQRPLRRREMHGVAGRWTMEQVTFTGCGLTWSLTLSYAPQYRSLRPTMLRMLTSFRLTCHHVSR